MARVELRRDLNAVVAKMAVEAVTRLAQAVADEGKDRAPDAKIWISRDDAKVRPAHVKAHHQTIPANLRFKLPKQRYERGVGTIVVLDEFDLARKPRDPKLPADQSKNCRCLSVTMTALIARRITTTPAVVTGTQVRAQVSVRFLRIIESEHGTDQDKAARFLGGAVDAVAARLRAKARRT